MLKTRRRVKVNKKNINSLSFDSISHIIRFLDSRRDFFAFVLVVKGLLNYIRSHNSCTRNIKFRATRFIPNKNPLDYVVNFSVGDMFGKSDVLKIFQSGDGKNQRRQRINKFGAIEKKLGEAFKFLEEVELLFISNENTPTNVKLEDFNSVVQISHRFDFLKVLTIVFTNMDFQLSQLLPKLEELEVTNLIEPFGQTSSFLYSRSYKKKKVLLPKKNLPMLKSLKLHGFKIDFSFIKDFKDQLLKVWFDNCDFPSSNIDDFKELRDFNIGFFSKIRRISNLEKLEEININGSGTYILERYQEMQLQMKEIPPVFSTEMRNLPNVTKLYIQGVEVFGNDQPSKYEAYDLKNLKEAFFLQCSVKARFIPNIEILYMEETYSVDIQLPNQEDCKLKTLIFRLDCSGIVGDEDVRGVNVDISKCKNTLKKLRIKAFGDQIDLHESFFQIVDFTSLEELFVGCMIDNSKEWEIGRNLPSLEGFELNVGHKGDFMDKITLFPMENVKSIEYSGSKSDFYLPLLQHLKEGLIFPKLENLKMNYFCLHGTDGVDFEVLDFSNLDIHKFFLIIRGITFTKTSTLKKISVKNCPFLNFLKISSTANTELSIQNLPMCEIVNIEGQQFKKFEMEGIFPSVKVLDLEIAFLDTGQEGLSLTGKKFPELEIICICNEKYSFFGEKDTTLPISEILGLRKLKKIVVKSNNMKFKICEGDVRDVDQENVEVVLLGVSIAPGSPRLVVFRGSLKEYLSNLKKLEKERNNCITL